MGIRHKTDIVWTEEEINNRLNLYFLSESSIKYRLNNLYVFDKAWESDYLAMTKSGYLYEGEIKNGFPHGTGKCYYNDGTWFEGKFAWGSRMDGTHYSATGEVIKVYE